MSKFKVNDLVIHKSFKDVVWKICTLVKTNTFGLYYDIIVVESRGSVFTIGYKTSSYEEHLTLRELAKSKEEQLNDKIAQLWNRQAWVMDGKPTATFYTKPVAQSVESKGMIEQEITSASIPTDTLTVLDADLVMERTTEEFLRRINQIENMSSQTYGIGLTQYQREPLSGFDLTTFP